MEHILRDYTVESFGVVTLASVTASVIGRAVFGSASFMSPPDFHVAHQVEYILFAVLGLLGALVGVEFTRFLYGMEDLCNRLWRGPEWLRPAVGGLLLGGLLAVPQMYGVGYPVLENAVNGRYVIAADPRLTRRIASLMEPVPDPLHGALTLEDASRLLALSEHGALPVLDDQGAYQGVVTARAGMALVAMFGVGCGGMWSVRK